MPSPTGTGEGRMADLFVRVGDHRHESSDPTTTPEGQGVKTGSSKVIKPYIPPHHLPTYSSNPSVNTVLTPLPLHPDHLDLNPSLRTAPT